MVSGERLNEKTNMNLCACGGTIKARNLCANCYARAYRAKRFTAREQLPKRKYRIAADPLEYKGTFERVRLSLTAADIFGARGLPMDAATIVSRGELGARRAAL